MKSLKRLLTTIGIIVLVIIIGNMITYTTKENEYAVVKQFGKIDHIVTEPGLNFNIPIVQTVTKIDKSKQFYDLPKSEVITADKKTMIVDAYILWRVTDPKLFTSSLNTSESTAEGRIDVIVYNAIKTTISSMTQEELVISRDNTIEVANGEANLDDLEIKDIVEDEEKSDESEFTGDAEVIAISKRLKDCVGTQCDQYGIEITDIKIKVLDLPDENKQAVYNRMITERNNIAAAYTAQGQSEAQVIKNTTDKEVSIMLAEAQATADKTIAEGEAEYMKILSDAYNNADKADFYLYTLSLDTAKKSLKNGKTTLFLDKNSPIAKIFQGQ